MDEFSKDIEEYNPSNKRKILILFDDMIADMLSNKKLNPVVNKLFIKGRKLNICSCFYYTILIYCSKRYYTKFYTLLYYENSK